MNRKNTISLFTLGLMLMSVLLFSCKKDENTPDPGAGGGGSNGTANKVLVIENGARTISPDANFAYSAYFVTKDGAIEPAGSISWSSSKTEVAEVSASGAITVKGTGQTVITGSVTVGGVTYTSSVPLGIRAPGIFAVAPSAVIIPTGTQIQFETAYFGQGSTTYSWTSSNNNVVSINSNGLASFNQAGEAFITVTASAQSDNPFIVPVIVVGAPAVTLPVSRVSVSPGSGEIFRNETLQFSAKAYDGNNAEVSKSFVWSVSDPSIATINSSGLLTGVGIGNAIVYAKADGVIGQAEVIVSPDTVIILSPMSVSLAPGATQQFTPTVYNLRTSTALTGFSGFTWTIPTYGIPMFDVATVNSSGLVTVKQNATPGFATVVECSLPSPTIYSGGALINVAMSQGEDCGPGNSAVATISVTNGNSFNLNVAMNPSVTLAVEAKDAGGNMVSDPALKFNSSNVQVATVSFDGTISAVGEGTATITICSGTFASKTVTVNVTLF